MGRVMLKLKDYSPWLLCLEAQDLLEKLGAKHAPIQRTTKKNAVYGREVTLRDPPGVYFLLGTDNDYRLGAQVQLLFLGVPDDTELFVKALPGWKILERRILPCDKGLPVPSAILEFDYHV